MLLAITFDQDGIRIDSQDSSISQTLAHPQRLPVEYRTGAIGATEYALQMHGSRRGFVLCGGLN
ncbi:hypothetical protein [Stutzerimonas stutzeri]|uniref:hypothetical protein n=1 Tax=Stutzerimonas stutzeri TaxID=316 RepID=UPI003144EBA2